MAFFISPGITNRNGGGVVDHHHGDRGHEHCGTRHSDDRSCGSGKPVDLDSHIAAVVHQHIVDLGCGKNVTAGTVDPDGNVPGTGIQLISEQSRGSPHRRTKSHR